MLVGIFAKLQAQNSKEYLKLPNLPPYARKYDTSPPIWEQTLVLHQKTFWKRGGWQKASGKNCKYEETLDCI